MVVVAAVVVVYITVSILIIIPGARDMYASRALSSWFQFRHWRSVVVCRSLSDTVIVDYVAVNNR